MCSYSFNYFSNTSNLHFGLSSLLKNLKPVIVIDNLHDPTTKAQAYLLLKPLGGIYLIYNKLTGKKYVGSAIVGNLHIRLHKHLYASSGNKLVHQAVKKDGLQNFVFVLVESIELLEISNKMDNAFLLDRENYYISLFKPEYNLAPLAGNTLGYVHSEDTKYKMRVNYYQERREQIGSLNRGKNLSEGTKQKIREAALKRGLCQKSID